MFRHLLEAKVDKKRTRLRKKETLLIVKIMEIIKTSKLSSFIGS